MNKYLFIFTIGPVQTFIAQARKVQDLFAGSAMLSDLVSLCINETRRQGHDIIFPFTENKEVKVHHHIELYTGDGTPNRFVAILNCETSEAVKTFGDGLVQLCRDAFRETVRNILKRLDIDIEEFSVDEQISDLLDEHWAAIPYTEDGKYSDQYKKLEQVIGAVKRVRRFGQFKEQGRKCSVNGLYNVKFYRKTDEEKTRPEKSLRESKLFAIENLVVGYDDTRVLKLSHIQPGEGLSGISLLKRLYKQVNGSNYPSTAKVALDHLLDIEKGGLQKMIADYQKNFSGDGFEHQLLYEENLTESYMKKYAIKHPGKSLESIISQQKNIKSVAHSQNLKFSKHYALLRFDGDNMGEWLGRAKSQEEHKAVSKALLELAQKAKSIVNDPDNYGKTIYAGGDDFLAVLNLSRLFEVLYELNMAVKETSKLFPIARGDREFTCSFSVYISHYKVPLSKALSLSDELLHRTKESTNILPQKNGTGIGFFKKSGSIGEVIIGNEKVGLMKEIWQSIINKEFNPRFIYKFAEEFALWSGEVKLANYMIYDAHAAFTEAEFLRLIQRGPKTEVKPAKARDLGEKMYENLILKDAKHYTIDLTNLLNGVRILEALHATI
jgi:CRISPR-associated protein Cmr2